MRERSLEVRRLGSGIAMAVALAWAAGCGADGTRAGFEGTDTDPTQGAAGGEDGTGSGGGGGGDVPAPQPDRVGCAGDKYSEALPTTASLSGIAFSPATAQDYLVEALGRRFPEGKFIAEGGMANPLPGNPSCFVGDKSSSAAVLRRASTIVHECGHFFDLSQGKGGASTYVITSELRLSCKSGDTTKRGGRTFERSRLNGDAYASKHPKCAGQGQQGCDFYAQIYLDGSPTDSQFQGGDQGYNSVLEEATQYVNSLATALAFPEVYQGTKVSERDGILTFLWYIERYLKMAREEYPDAYELLSTDECWRQATLTVWDRGRFFLEATKDKTNLGIQDSKLEGLVADPDLVAEIDALRKLECQ